MNSDDLEIYLRAAIDNSASDLILQEGRPPAYRVDGSLALAEDRSISSELMDALWKRCGLSENDSDGDSAIVSEDGTRFRVNLLRQLSVRSAVLRRIQNQVPAMNELGLPETLLMDWASRGSGLVLVCGPTGSGKSTTVASMVDWINREKPKHIVTIEDPVEYVFSPQKAVITQREVGLDTPSFAEGMRRALRQSPDVIFVGEIRDRTTAEIALQASETGHLVLSTLHVGRAIEAPARLGLLFPEQERQFISHVLSREIIGVICQRLVPGSNGGVLPALEYFSNTGIVSKYIEEGRSDELADLLASPKTQDARSLTNDLVEKLRAGDITEETARAAAPDPLEITRALRGIK